jgi:hypothetical protein
MSATLCQRSALDWREQVARIERSEIRERSRRPDADPGFHSVQSGLRLLKANPKRSLTNDTLGKVLDELQSDLGFGAKPKIGSLTGGFNFQTIVKDLSSDDNCVYTAVVRTARIRNTTEHNLGWQVSLTAKEYNSLAAYVASSCLHAIACLYR